MTTPVQYDVIVLGGAFAGASTALLLRRDHPQLKVLVIEKLEQFDEKVGEATTEMSAMFLTRRLAQWRHLELEQLPKEGLRYWFHNDKVTGHVNATETGSFYRSAVPAFQLRRDALDEHLLADAVREGAELLRPARVRDVELMDFDNKVTVEVNGETRVFGARWVVDATGRVNYLARKLGILEKNEQHPTASMWARFRDVRHIDEIAARGPNSLARGNIGSRRLATNHYMGFGHWIWVIPLKNGETSIGVVWDKRLVNLHESKDRQNDFIAFLKQKAALAELLEGSSMRSEDFRYYSNLPYATRQYMGNGWALVGDAAVFLDPYYSPGLDHAGFSVEATVRLIGLDAQGENITASIAEHNKTFIRSYWRFFRSVYLDKYYYMGEADLLTAAFLIDTATYYIFIVMRAYRFLGRFDWMPVFGQTGAGASYVFMSFYNRRMKKIAIARRQAGEEGLRNNGQRTKALYNFNFAPFRMLLRGTKMWLRAELDLLRIRVMTPFRSGTKPAAAPSGEAATTAQ